MTDQTDNRKNAGEPSEQLSAADRISQKLRRRKRQNKVRSVVKKSVAVAALAAVVILGAVCIYRYWDVFKPESFQKAVTVRDKEMGGYILESKIPLHNLSNDKIAQLVPAAGTTVGFDFSILDVDLPCPGIHSLRMQYSAQLDGRDRKPTMHNVDENPSLWGTLTFVD